MWSKGRAANQPAEFASTLHTVKSVRSRRYLRREAAVVDITEVQVVTPAAPMEAYVPPPAPVVVEPAPAPEPVAVAEPQPMTPMTSAQTSETELPQTAGNVPLIALIGLLSIAAAVAFRAVRRA